MSDRRDPRLEQALRQRSAANRDPAPQIAIEVQDVRRAGSVATAFMLVRRPDGEQQVELVLRRNGDGWAVVRTPEVCAAAGCG
ncbi:MAG: hypothetical protein ACR2JU_00140 [Nocardioidaceae bacterium]